jgi:hypothetical protein
MPRHRAQLEVQRLEVPAQHLVQLLHRPGIAEPAQHATVTVAGFMRRADSASPSGGMYCQHHPKRGE